MTTNNKIITISAQQLQEKKSQNPELIIINVLAEKYYQDCHIPGSINIPYDKLVEQVSSWNKDKEIVLYCASSTCPKSKQAYELLKDFGFSKLHEYPGGMKEWLQKGLPVEGPCSENYLNE